MDPIPCRIVLYDSYHISLANFHRDCLARGEADSPAFRRFRESLELFWTSLFQVLVPRLRACDIIYHVSIWLINCPSSLVLQLRMAHRYSTRPKVFRALECYGWLNTLDMEVYI